MEGRAPSRPPARTSRSRPPPRPGHDGVWPSRERTTTHKWRDALRRVRPPRTSRSRPPPRTSRPRRSVALQGDACHGSIRSATKCLPHAPVGNQPGPPLHLKVRGASGCLLWTPVAKATAATLGSTCTKQPGPPLVLLRRGEHALSQAIPTQGSPGCSATWVYRRQGGASHFGHARVPAPRPSGCLLHAPVGKQPGLPLHLKVRGARGCLLWTPVAKATAATLGSTCPTQPGPPWV